MSSFSEQALQEKLNRLSASQDSIETLSLWIIHHRTHASISVTIWLQNFVQADPDHRLLLLFLANDVLQNSRRKGIVMFHDLFADPLKHAASLVSGLKIQTSVERIFRIWKERRVYENTFLKELQDLIEPQKKGVNPGASTSTSEFKISLLEDSLTELQKFEGEMKIKSSVLSRVRIDVSSTSSLSKLKDKSAGGKFKSEFEDSSHKLQDYNECLGIEVNERKNLLEMLRQCRSYHTDKFVELQGLLKDYSNLQGHFENLKLKLKEKVDELEKATHTATSDPTSKKDITVAGDMEIDSDTESQEESSSQPSVPDQFQLPPSTQFPQPTFHRNNFPFAIPSPLTIPLNSPLRPLLPTGPAYTTLQHAIPYSPSMPKPQGHFIRTLLPSGINPTILRLSSPISLTTINNANIGSIENINNLPTHSRPNLENIEAVIIPDSTPTVQITSLPSISAPLSTSVSLPIIYSSSTPSGNETVVPLQRDMSSSLEDRLKGLVNQKALPESLFQDYSDSDSEDDKEEEGGKPYSPSAIHSVTVDFSNSKDNEDKESLPTPNMSPVTPEYLKSPLEYASSNVTKSTSAPFPAYTVHNYTATPNNELINASMNAPSVDYTRISYNQEDNQREMNRGGDKGSIGGGLAALLNSITQSKDSINTMTVQSSADTSVTNTTGKSFDPENIKITPSLTNLLDKIFPQLSQSLQSERKRKLDETSETHSNSTKVAKNETVNTSNMKDITNEDIPSVTTPTESNFETNSQLVSEFTRDIEKISNQVPHPPLKPFPIPEPPGFTHPQMRPPMPHFELRSAPPPMPFPPRPHFNNQQHPNFGPPRGDFSLPQRFPPMNNIPPPPFPHGPPRFFRHQFPPPTLRPRYY